MGHSVSRHHTDLSDLNCHLRLWWCLGLYWCRELCLCPTGSGVWFVSMVWVVTIDHGDVHDCTAAEIYVEVRRPCFRHESHVDVGGQLCLLKSCLCPWYGQISRALCRSVSLLRLGTMFMVYVVDKNQVEAHDLCSHWLNSEESIVIWYWWLQMRSWEGETWKAAVTICSPLTAPPKSYNLDRKHPRELLKSVMEMLKDSFPQLKDSVRGLEGWCGRSFCLCIAFIG